MSTTPVKGGPARNSQRPPKLRLSCDSCASAKVKCSKEQPQCERCIANGSACFYRPSKRWGKPPRDPNPNSSSVNKEAIQPSTAASEDVRHKKYNDQSAYNPNGMETDQNALLQWSDIQFGADTFSNRTSPFPNADDTAMFGADGLEYLMDPSNMQLDAQGAHLGSSSSMAFPPLDFQDLDLPLGADRSGRSSHSTSSVNLQGDFGMVSPPRTGQQHPGSLSHTSCGGRNCYTLVNTTLSNLHYQRPFTSMAQGSSSSGISPNSQSEPQPGIPSLESVLSNNKAAIHNVLQLLNCPCAADAHMALLYASITSKILIWYQVAGGVAVSSSSPVAAGEHAAASETPSHGSRSSSATSGVSTPSYRASAFGDQTVKVGSFMPDEECQGAMRQTLLLGELNKARVLVHALSRMHEGGNDTVKPDGPASNLYGTLGSWLQVELERTINEVKESPRMQQAL